MKKRGGEETMYFSNVARTKGKKGRTRAQLTRASGRDGGIVCRFAKKKSGECLGEDYREEGEREKKAVALSNK